MQNSLYGLPIDEFLSIKFGSPKIQSRGPHQSVKNIARTYYILLSERNGTLIFHNLFFFL